MVNPYHFISIQSAFTTTNAVNKLHVLAKGSILYIDISSYTTFTCTRCLYTFRQTNLSLVVIID